MEKHMEKNNADRNEHILIQIRSASLDLAFLNIPSKPRKINMSPENQWLEDAFAIEIVSF